MCAQQQVHYDLRLSLRGIGWLVFWDRMVNGLGLDLRIVDEAARIKPVTAEMLATSESATPHMSASGTLVQKAELVDMDRGGRAKTPRFCKDIVAPSYNLTSNGGISGPALQQSVKAKADLALDVLTQRQQRQQHCLAHHQASLRVRRMYLLLVHATALAKLFQPWLLLRSVSCVFRVCVCACWQQTIQQTIGKDSPQAARANIKITELKRALCRTGLGTFFHFLSVY